MSAALWRFELAAARRTRTVPLFAAGFAIASVAVALVGLSAGGVVQVQGFARTSVSLMQLVIWIVPLLALIIGAVAGAESYDMEFVTALPLARSRVLVVRWGAWTVALGAALLIGLGAAGLVIGIFAGGADAGRYFALIVVSWLLLAATLAIGFAIGVVGHTRARATALAIVVWFVLVIGIDLLAIGSLAVLPARGAGWGLTLLLAADPVDAARTLGLGLFQADALAGPTGAALRQVLGGFGAWMLLAALAAWTAAPLALACRRFQRRDL